MQGTYSTASKHLFYTFKIPASTKLGKKKSSKEHKRYHMNDYKFLKCILK